MVKNLFGLLCLPFLFSCLQAQENPPSQKDDTMVINSGEAQYDGKEIILVGQVTIQHSLGQISARRLSIQSSSDKDKKNKFGFLKINEEIEIELKEGGKLYCQQAEVDYAKMQGVFLGNESQPDVIYLNAGEGKEEGIQKVRSPIELKSSQMTLELIRDSTTATSSAKTLVKQIEANHNVRVRYNQDHLILADHALYQRLADGQSSSIAGFLTLTVRDNLPACKMTNLNGDRISAQMVRVNTIERTLWLSQPVGTLYIKRTMQPTQTLDFSAQELVWNDPQQSLLLKKEVNITQNDVLHIHTSHELSIAQAIVNGNKTLRFLYSPQDTQVSYSDIQKGNTHKMLCPGPFMIDHERLEMKLQGLKNEGQQVYIDHVLGEMYADDVHIHYAWENQRLAPGRIILEGHVRLMNRFDGHIEESGSTLHYALADHVEYFPQQQEMVLAGKNGNRVLFFDKVNNIQMSAPSLKVRYDAATKKESIQGLGDVRFTFMEKELEQLKRHFPLTHSSQKELEGAESKEK